MFKWKADIDTSVVTKRMDVNCQKKQLWRAFIVNSAELSACTTAFDLLHPIVNAPSFYQTEAALLCPAHETVSGAGHCRSEPRAVVRLTVH